MNRFTFGLALLILVNTLNAAPGVKEKPPQILNLEKTVWIGKTLEGQEMTIYFHTEGRMRVIYTGVDCEIASWKQDGKKIYFEMNNQFCEFNGALAQDEISGDSQNIHGKKWKTTLKRQADAEIKPLQGAGQSPKLPARGVIDTTRD